MTANEIALTAVKALDSKKGQDIKCLETGHLTTLADYFVLCTATSTTQIKALADVCEKALKDAGEPPHHVEGHRGEYSIRTSCATRSSAATLVIDFLPEVVGCGWGVCRFQTV